MIHRQIFLVRSGTNIGLTVRFKCIEGIGTACTSVNASYGSPLDTVDAPRVVIHTRQAGTRIPAVDPQGQTSIICAAGSRGTPVDFNGVRRIANSEPAAARPAIAVVTEGGPQLIVAFRKTKLNPQNQCGCRSIAIENIMGVVARHRDRIWVKVKTGAIAGFCVW